MGGMSEQDLLARIKELVDREHELRSQAENREIDPATERRELAALEVALDQCWDLLRQRRARLDAGESPEDAAVNPPGQVENYLQ